MKLYLIRHGQTDWNIEQRIQGQQDIPLNDTGRAQARCLTQAMKEKKLDAIYTSPQIRAYATAGAVAGNRPIPVVALPWLMEINYGDWEGKTAKELLKKMGTATKPGGIVRQGSASRRGDRGPGGRPLCGRLGLDQKPDEGRYGYRVSWRTAGPFYGAAAKGQRRG